MLRWVLIALLLVGCSKKQTPPDPAAKGASPPVAEAKDSAAPDPGESEPAGPATRKKTTIKPPGHLPPLARRILHESMQRHGDHAESLLWSALMLDHAAAREIATWVADDLAIARPMAGQEDALNTLLPEAYFEQQDALRAAAQELAAAAYAKDDQAVARAYGELTKTCITCHSLYMRLPPPAEAREQAE